MNLTNPELIYCVSVQIEVSRRERVHTRSYVCRKLTWYPIGKIEHTTCEYGSELG